MVYRDQTHSKSVAYLLWIVGFSGAHRFYLGRRFTGLLWFLTAGLLGIGWLVDLFLIPKMCEQPQPHYTIGELNYSIAWVLLAFGGFLGLHRFYQEKIGTGVLYLLTFGLFGLGLIYDYFTLNEQIDRYNQDHLIIVY